MLQQYILERAISLECWWCKLKSWAINAPSPRFYHSSTKLKHYISKWYYHFKRCSALLAECWDNTKIRTNIKTSMDSCTYNPYVPTCTSFIVFVCFFVSTTVSLLQTVYSEYKFHGYIKKPLHCRDHPIMINSIVRFLADWNESHVVRNQQTLVVKFKSFSTPWLIVCCGMPVIHVRLEYSSSRINCTQFSIRLEM